MITHLLCKISLLLVLDIELNPSPSFSHIDQTIYEKAFLKRVTAQKWRKDITNGKWTRFE